MTSYCLAEARSQKAQERSTLHVAHVIHSLDVGGAETDLVRKAAILAACGGFRCSVLTFSRAGSMAAAARGAGIQVYGFGGRGALCAAHGIRRWLAQHRPSVVHAHLLNGAVLGGISSRLAGRLPLVWTAQYIYRGAALKIRLLRRPFLDWPSLIVASSRAVAEGLLGLGVDPHRIRVVYNCVDAALWSRPVEAATRRRVRDHLNIPTGAFVVGSVGRLVPDKSMETLVTAVPYLHAAGHDAYLVLVGDGPERAYLEALSARLGLKDRVILTGARPDVPDLLDAMDVFVLPSRNEALGIAAIEASARGRPVVASRAGGLPEVVVQGETGLLFDPSDARDCARALIALAGRPDWAAALGAAGRRRVRNQFDCRSLAEVQRAIYEEVASIDGAAPM